MVNWRRSRSVSVNVCRASSDRNFSFDRFTYVSKSSTAGSSSMGASAAGAFSVDSVDPMKPKPVSPGMGSGAGRSPYTSEARRSRGAASSSFLVSSATGVAAAVVGGVALLSPDISSELYTEPRNVEYVCGATLSATVGTAGSVVSAVAGTGGESVVFL